MAMMHFDEPVFRWGPIPGRLLSIAHCRPLSQLFPRRLHQYSWPPSYMLIRGGQMLYICSEHALRDVGGNVFRDVAMRPSARRRYVQHWMASVRRLHRFEREVRPSSLSVMTDRMLMRLWMRLNAEIYTFWKSGMLPELAAYGGEQVLRDALADQNNDGAWIRRMLPLLSTPARPSFYQEEERDLWKAMSSSDPVRRIAQHQRKYAWIENSYFQTAVVSGEKFLHRAKRIPNPAQCRTVIESQHRSSGRNRAAALRRTHSTEVRRIADALAHSIWWQDQRKKEIFRYLGTYHTISEEIARRLGAPHRLFDNALPEEIRLPLPRRTLETLKRRDGKTLALSMAGNTIRLLVGHPADTIVRRYWNVPKQSRNTLLEGTVAYHRRQPVSGVVQVIRDHADLASFRRGHVLVAPMTAPEYIGAFRMARAVVTDAGGLTSHAAIVSRELRIPCIVGTKNATSVLKDGDHVTVNTDAGTITKQHT